MLKSEETVLEWSVVALERTPKPKDIYYGSFNYFADDKINVILYVRKYIQIFKNIIQ
jgi:hypothetical protein